MIGNIMLRVEVVGGSIRNVINSSIELSKQVNVPIIFMFNGIQILVDSFSDAQEKESQYFKELREADLWK